MPRVQRVQRLERQHKPKFRPRVFRCPYHCGMFCRSASGLTQHRTVCSLNPANSRLLSPIPPPSPPRTPPRGNSPNPVFRTPRRRHSQPNTPQQGSPHRNRLIVSAGGVRTRTHPYLDGTNSSLSISYVLTFNFMKANHVIRMVTTFLKTIHHHPKSSAQTMITSHIPPIPSLNSWTFCFVANRCRGRISPT